MVVSTRDDCFNHHHALQHVRVVVLPPITKGI